VPFRLCTISRTGPGFVQFFNGSVAKDRDGFRSGARSGLSGATDPRNYWALAADCPSQWLRSRRSCPVEEHPKSRGSVSASTSNPRTSRQRRADWRELAARDRCPVSVRRSPAMAETGSPLREAEQDRAGAQEREERPTATARLAAALVAQPRLSDRKGSLDLPAETHGQECCLHSLGVETQHPSSPTWRNPAAEVGASSCLEGRLLDLRYVETRSIRSNWSGRRLIPKPRNRQLIPKPRNRRRDGVRQWRGSPTEGALELTAIHDPGSL
jgi:hypothetical protein